MSKLQKVELQIETHGETEHIVHFHLGECPVCQSKNAPTNYYGSPLDCIDEGGEFYCQRCNAQFQLVSYDCAEEPNAEIQILD